MISEPLTPSSSNPVLAAKGLTRRFGGLIAVNDVSFTVQKHEIFRLIGPNGAGKTTLFNVMTGLIPASSGNLIYQNENISKLRPYQIANKGIGQNISKYSVVWRTFCFGKCGDRATHPQSIGKSSFIGAGGDFRLASI